MASLQDCNIKIFADGADLEDISKLASNPLIKGFTTNPSLMRKANVRDYKAFSLDVLSIIDGRPVSFEVFSDDFLEMERQADEIASWGDNIYVKIPVTNTAGQFSGPLLERLSKNGIQVNVTALMTVYQCERVVACLSPEVPSIVSVFAGRVADTGKDPVPTMKDCLSALQFNPKSELIWASPRELLNIFQADSIGCHIITVTSDVLAKLDIVGKDLDNYSLQTVKMFFEDALAAGYTIDTKQSIHANTGAQL